MMKVLINFANNGYINSRKLLKETALDIGNIDKVIEYSTNDIDSDFFEKNKHIFSSPRGFGFWLWKPYFILKTLLRLNDDDILIYSDAGLYFISDIDNYIRFMSGSFMLFQHIEYPEKDWTKTDLFNYFDCKNNKDITDTYQLYACSSIWKKNENSINFLREWLRLCENYHFISDEASIEANAATFQDNRHDQSIMSCLAKLNKDKYNIQIEKDPTQTGNNEFRNKVFPQLIINHHNRN